jgi:hypothetical protein
MRRYSVGIIMGVNPPDPLAGSPGVPPYSFYEPARYAMGDTLRYAEKMNLLAMEPHANLSSTGFALVNLGKEYLVLQPDDTSDSFTVALGPGAYEVEWFNVNRRETKSAKNVKIEKEENTRFTTPFSLASPAVLYLKKAER